MTSLLAAAAHMSTSQRWTVCSGVLLMKVRYDVLLQKAVRRVVISDIIVTSADVTLDPGVDSTVPNFEVSVDSSGNLLTAADVRAAAASPSALFMTSSFFFVSR